MMTAKHVLQWLSGCDSVCIEWIVLGFGVADWVTGIRY